MHRYLVLQAHKQEFACIEEVLKQKRIAEHLPYLYEKYSGYHHDKNWSLVKKGKVKFLTKPEVCPKTGLVSVAKLEIEGVIVKDKTFFPPRWSRRKVIDKIVEASKNIEYKEFQGARIEYKGITNEGMKIKMIVDENKKLITAFPVSE